MRDDKFVRISWELLSHPRQSDGVELILMDNVSKVEIAHLDANGNSHPDWPPPNAPSNTGKLLPRMIEMKISFEDETEVSRLYPGVFSN